MNPMKVVAMKHSAGKSIILKSLFCIYILQLKQLRKNVSTTKRNAHFCIVYAVDIIM